MHTRNRYYDPATWRFTQQDPIGLTGGLNLYGFAGGDPVNFSDPFGLEPVHVGCRAIPSSGEEGKPATGTAHCAIRIGDDVYELLPDPETGLNKIALASEKQAERYDGRWQLVALPGGVSEGDFSLLVRQNIVGLAQERNSEAYSYFGDKNSNRFVYDAITGSGGRVPFAAALKAGGRPIGLCGGKFTVGVDCAGYSMYNQLIGIP